MNEQQIFMSLDQELRPRVNNRSMSEHVEIRRKRERDLETGRRNEQRHRGQREKELQNKLYKYDRERTVTARKID